MFASAKTSTIRSTPMAKRIGRWRWLILQPMRPWFATSLGGVFLGDAPGPALSLRPA